MKLFFEANYNAIAASVPTLSNATTAVYATTEQVKMVTARELADTTYDDITIIGAAACMTIMMLVCVVLAIRSVISTKYKKEKEYSMSNTQDSGENGEDPFVINLREMGMI
ncbi:uncharacterized protein LOC102802367 [Saccoglossus kowalevskii]|uniref:Uncharacterized protein LOC102802367 n=1 Tax=Saccoglossus kowalevskii TaxID=10224 RepID=A0ABM0MUS4_SACKO|nr:PREDICTED: uncharacterized protein LOC102802367 [Saccoglossus kowalevskii]